MNKSIFIVYLNNCVTSDEFSYLHHYLHPGIFEKDSKAALTCKDIVADPYYLLLTMLAPHEVKGRKVRIPHSLVVAILEPSPQDSQVGFLGQSESRAQST